MNKTICLFIIFLISNFLIGFFGAMYESYKTGTLPIYKESICEEPFGYPELTDIDKAVLQAIPFKFYIISSHDLPNEQALQIEAENVARLKNWAATLPNGPVKCSYFGWANSFESDIFKIRKELQTHVLEAARIAEQNRVNALLPTIPKPPEQ